MEQVKGITYDLRHFLGDIDLEESEEKITYTEEDNKKYVKSLLKNPANQLYQITVYLAPGDYHRFHSPTDWEIEFRRHFQGTDFSFMFKNLLKNATYIIKKFVQVNY